MHYTFEYGQIAPYIPTFLKGALITLELSGESFLGGFLLGLVGASLLTYGPAKARRVVGAYVTFFTNTPLLVQIYFLFFVLPSAGVLLSPYSAALLGMTLNAGAYLTEIQRAGFSSMPRQELEAAETIGMTKPQMVRLVILPHIARTLFAPLSNHYIVMVLGSSVAAIFGVNELTGSGLSAVATTFRAPEIFSLVGGLYVVITLIASAILMAAARLLLGVRLKM